MAAEKIKLAHPIYVLVTEGSKKVFEKSFDRAPITIGRSLSCDVPLAQFNWISRQHFQVVAVENRWIAVDLNSSSGIKHQGQKHTQLTLESGMKLEIGPLTFQFHFEGAPGFIRPARIATSPSISVQDMTATQYEVEQPYPQIEIKKPTLVPPRVSKAAHRPPRPIQFRQPDKAKISGAWFTHAEGGKRPILAKANGAAALKIDRFFESNTRINGGRTVLEVHLTWKDQLYDSKLYFSGETISVGVKPDDLYAPTLKGSFVLGRFDGQQADLFLGRGAKGLLHRSDRKFTIDQLIESGVLARRGKSYVLPVTQQERCEIDLGFGLKLNVRHAAAPRQLSKAKMREPDKIMKKALTYSGSAHMAFLLLALLLAPAKEIPKVKHLPPRVAKLLLPKEPIPEVTKPVEEPKPELPKIAKEEPIKPPKLKPQPKRKPPAPKRVVVRTNEKMKVINKLPPARVAQEKPVEGPKVVEPPPDINSLGALAALGALGAPTPNPSQKPVAININPNAGGQASASTTGVIGAVKAAGGKLSAAGMAGVKTTGKGYGTGAGYGVQGLQGTAGSRGVAGAVIGSPRLMDISRTEGLTQKQVMDVVKQYTSKIQQCYERSLLGNPNLAGRVEYEWEITAKGAVQWAKVKRSDVSNGDTLNNCVTTVLKSMRFPIASNGETTTPTIGFPFGRL